ncbi:interferon lambda-3-like [Lepus europaeus]|uniref:interferon lambda-3-like n=1 Tax=Lepus europaeus TaxID=9983 RepID=UPI002B472F35|nr:interferon lambda-3-like [Lepus europaeus]
MAASLNLIVLVLLVVVLNAARAGPVPPTKSTTAGRDCRIDSFKSLSPRELEAFKTARDALEESLLLKSRRCTSRIFPRAWDLKQLQVWERPEALEAELALSLKVLEAMEDSAPGHVLEPPLRTLRHIHTQLRACVSPRPTTRPKPRGRLHHWLHRLQEAPKKEAPACLEVSVIFNLFRLLTRDLKCVASGPLCA